MVLLLLSLGCPPSDKEEVEDTSPTTNNPDGDDDDGDGYIDDCDDNNPGIFPGAAELCDGLDNDCDNLVDNDAVDATIWYEDHDSDGFGNPDESQRSCDPIPGWVSNDKDCDDNDAAYNPGAIENDCEDPNDYNCDGSVGYEDDDGDGFAACEDCDDSSDAVHPLATETCNDLDDDCNGLTDDQDPFLQGAATWHLDADQDGWGGTLLTLEACEQPQGYVANDDDCDDLDASSYPGGAEVCDEADNDCDGDVDEDVADTWHNDADGDGYGDPTVTTQACDPPQGFVANDGDCDDTNAQTNPGQYEICDGEDNDCDTSVDDNAIDATTWYVDLDGDGFGDPSTSLDECDEPSGYADNDEDCDDTDADVNPDEDEVWYDGVDGDCDGASDYDADGDGYDSDDYGGADCDDTDPSIYQNCELYSFSAHTFTACGQTGRYGPTLAMCRGVYSTAWDEDSAYLNMNSQGIQLWTVPADGVYEITAVGAGAGSGNYYNSYPGRGAYMYGEFTLSQGDVLQILVGQKGQTVNYNGGAGGGTFVVTSGGTPLIIAGGGGGPYRDRNDRSYSDASTGTSGQSSSCSGGSSGAGATSCSGSYAGGGGGLSSSGSNGYGNTTGGQGFAQGGAGGQCDASCGNNAGAGGFGGGGGVYHDNSGGGGGGYSGGGKGPGVSGGGGGSYNSGTNTSSSAAYNTGDGYVTITLQ